MVPMRTMSSNPKKLLVKSASMDHFARDNSSSSEDEEVGGGVRLHVDNGMPSKPSKRPTQRPASSAMAEPPPRTPDFAAFQVGNTQDDDVFTEKAIVHSNRDDVSDNTPPSLAQQVQVSYPVAHEGEQVSETYAPVCSLQIDAQNIYPPSACIFVANLPAAFNDGLLEAEMTRFFSQFGNVFVKVRRDNRHMPFAFCQFTCDADAKRAEALGAGTQVLGRPLRIEMAKAHSTWIVYKPSGRATTKQEAVSLLGVLGDIAKARPLDERMRAALGLPPAMVVQYRMYDPKRDVARTFEKHCVFKVIAFEPKTLNPQPAPTQNHRLSEEDAMSQYERDRRSAFFGNLPLSINDGRLRRLAAAWGQIANIDIKRKHVPSGHNRSVQICFAFVEFTRPESVDEVVSALAGMNIDGYNIRVERKQCRLHNTAAVQNEGPTHSDAPHLQLVQGRVAGGALGHHKNSYSRSFSVPGLDNPAIFSPPTVGRPGGRIASSVHVRGPDHPALRYASQANLSPLVSVGSAVSRNLDTPSSDITNTSKSVSFDECGESGGECKQAHEEWSSLTADTDAVKGGGQQKPLAQGPATAAAASLAGIAEAKSDTEAAVGSQGGFPMMGMPMSPYGYSTVHQNMMQPPMTPQSAVFYNNGYPGYGFSPMPTPMDAYFYHQHLAMLAAASYHEMETPTRPTGSCQQGEDHGSASKNTGRQAQHPPTKDLVNDQSIAES